jgi:hypothetical protein
MNETTPHHHLSLTSGMPKDFSLHTHTASNGRTTAHGYRLASLRVVSRETPGQSVWYLWGQWGTHFPPPCKHFDFQLSVLFHHCSTLIHPFITWRYLISGKDNIFQRHTKTVAVLRFFLPVSLRQCSHVHPFTTDVIQSQQQTMSLEKATFAVRVLRGAYLTRQILLSFVELSIRGLRISCRAVRGQ